MQGSREDRSIGELFSDLTRDTTTLVRKEIELAKTEMTVKLTDVGKNVGSLAVGGAIAYAGLLALIAGIIIALAEFTPLPLWASALLVGLIVAGIGYYLVQQGLDALKRVDLAPRETIQTLKEDKEWAQDQTR